MITRVTQEAAMVQGRGDGGVLEDIHAHLSASGKRGCQRERSKECEDEATALHYFTFSLEDGER
jgi:hypothetical protein